MLYLQLPQLLLALMKRTWCSMHINWWNFIILLHLLPISLLSYIRCFCSFKIINNISFWETKRYNNNYNAYSVLKIITLHFDTQGLAPFGKTLAKTFLGGLITGWDLRYATSGEQGALVLHMTCCLLQM